MMQFRIDENGDRIPADYVYKVVLKVCKE